MEVSLPHAEGIGPVNLFPKKYMLTKKRQENELVTRMSLSLLKAVSTYGLSLQGFRFPKVEIRQSRKLSRRNSLWRQGNNGNDERFNCRVFQSVLFLILPRVVKAPISVGTVPESCGFKSTNVWTA